MNAADVATRADMVRISILLSEDLNELHVPALKYLILHLNRLQSTFEYQFLPQPKSSRFLNYLSGNTPKDRMLVQREVSRFLSEYKAFLAGSQRQFPHLQEPLPEYYIVISLARFSDNYYLAESGQVGIIALGNWERFMAPPSLLEFILSLVIVESVYLVSTTIGHLSHLGTKGCLFDFNPQLENVRFGVLEGYICNHCRQKIAGSEFPRLAAELSEILDKKWLGQSSDPSSPAGVVANFGYDLFLTKGIKPTLWERTMSTLQQEGVKQLLKLVGTLIVAVILFYLGIKSG